MLRSLAFSLLLLFASQAQADCVSRGLTSNCYTPGGNSYLARPGQNLLPMPQADPRIEPRVSPEQRLGGNRPRGARGPFPTVNGRVLRHPGIDPCRGAACNRQQRYFPQACRSPRCL